MKTVRNVIAGTHSWMVYVYLTIRYLLARRGMGKAIPFDTQPAHVIRAARQLFRWDKRVRVVNANHCPDSAPTVFASNHFKLDDPLYLWPAIHDCSKTNIMVKFMMRDDYFVKFPYKWWLLDLNEVAVLHNAMLISRNQLSLAQLKPFINILCNGGAFLIFPGRTRSRSGLCIEYREDMEDPASVAFFVSQAQRRNPEAPVPVVPMGRTWHPVKKTSAVVFGAPLYLPLNADRKAQRSLDTEMLLRMANLIEINALHLVAAFLWLRCLHQLPISLSLTEIQDALAPLPNALSTRYIEPDLKANPNREITIAVDYFVQKQCISWQNRRSLTLDKTQILYVPELTTRYRKDNPVKYQANQVAHLPDVVALLEAAVLKHVPKREVQKRAS